MGSTYLALLSAVLGTVVAYPSNTYNLLTSRQKSLGSNTSALPAPWGGSGICWEDVTPDTNPFLLGPTFTSSEMTIEICVGFCEKEGYRMAGTEFGDECFCGNMYNPTTGFESEPSQECNVPCEGNPAETCGGNNPEPPYNPEFIYILTKNDNLYPGRGEYLPQLTYGNWRFSYAYTDSVSARALPHNAVDLHPSLVRGNLTIEACLNACGNAGYLIAGMEYGDECYCGNALENDSQPIQGYDPTAGQMQCKGDPSEYCGGPNMLFIYILPGAGLFSLIPFGSQYNGI